MPCARRCRVPLSRFLGLTPPNPPPCDPRRAQARLTPSKSDCVGFLQQGGIVSKRALFGGMLVILAATLGARNAAAQARVITGKVTSAQTGQGIARASVSVVGTVIVAQTNDAGEYSLSAPAGQVRLLMRAVGFKRRQVTVTADQPTADVALDQDVFNLEAVVVTGQATAVAQQNLANAVATIAPEALTRAPTATIENAVQGKIPGALVQTNSGAPAVVRLSPWEAFPPSTAASTR